MMPPVVLHWFCLVVLWLYFFCFCNEVYLEYDHKLNETKTGHKLHNAHVDAAFSSMLHFVYLSSRDEM